jgi:enoyl-CoA hydratase/carnithine racemase
MSEITIEVIGRTHVLTLNSPESRNALTRGTLASLSRALDAASNDADARCVIIAGAGGHFCAGADLRRSFAEDPELMNRLDETMDAYHGLIRALVRCTKPTIARLEGAAVGFGADLALACDLRIASESAYVQEKFVKIGLMPDGGGTFWLPRLVGTSRAMRYVLLGDKIEARDLVDLGLVVRMVPEADIVNAALDLARQIEKGPPLAHAEIKRAVMANLGDLEGALRREREGQLRLLKTNDLIEGVTAWTLKREPNFQGK